MVRLFIKGAVEKARQKIKDLYGVHIADKAPLQQIVDTAKQSYGGNRDLAIRTAQFRDLIQLYARSTGQPTKTMPATVHPLDLVQSGGRSTSRLGTRTARRSPVWAGFRRSTASAAAWRGSGGDPTRRPCDNQPPARTGGAGRRQ